MTLGNEDGTCADCGEPVWWQDHLVDRDGVRWCYGPGRKRVQMTHWHHLAGMAQYVVPSLENRVCRCLAHKEPHVHRIEVITTDAAHGEPWSPASPG